MIAAGPRAYRYDANGNRIDPGYVIGPDNQVLSDGTWDYTYDADGNEVGKVALATGVSWAYGYDDANQMTSAVEYAAGGKAILARVAYTYDVFGNRLEEDTFTAATGVQAVQRYGYDGQNVWADLNSSNQLETRYLYGDGVDQILARVAAGGVVGWYLTDRLGSVRDVMSNAGAILDHRDYDAFGNITYETNPAAGDRYGFTGREFDAATGLQYNRARYYDASMGRWTSQDPDGVNAGDADLYRYVGNDATNLVDDSGLADGPPGGWDWPQVSGTGAFFGSLWDNTAGAMYSVATGEAGRQLGERAYRKSEFRHGPGVPSYGGALYASAEDLIGADAVEAIAGYDESGNEIPGELFDGGPRSQKLANGTAAFTTSVIGGTKFVAKVTPLGPRMYPKAPAAPAPAPIEDVTGPKAISREGIFGDKINDSGIELKNVAEAEAAATKPVAPKGGPNVPLKTIQDQASGATAHIEINNGVAQIEIGYMQKVTKGFVDSIRNYAKQNGATSAVLNTGPIINTDLTIKLGLHASRGEKYFGGTVKLIQGGKTPIFEIQFD